MKTVLQTARISMREWSRADLDRLATMVGDQDQMRLYPRPKTRSEALAWIDRNRALHEEHGFCFWLMESIKEAEFLGYCGIRPWSLAGADEIEIGWHTRKEFWNRGFATEAANACRDLAFSRFDLGRLIGEIDPANSASRRVAEKIGMRPERKVVRDGYSFIIFAVERAGR